MLLLPPVLKDIEKSQLCVVDSLGSFSMDSAGQLDVLGHDGDTFSVDGTQIGVFKHTD